MFWYGELTMTMIITINSYDLQFMKMSGTMLSALNIFSHLFLATIVYSTPPIPPFHRLSWWFCVICLQCRKHGFDLWVQKIPEEGNGYPLQCACLGKSHRQRSLSMGLQRVGHDLPTELQQQSYTRRC